MKTKEFDVQGMSCSACSANVQRAVEKTEGVHSASVNLLTNSMTVSFDDSVADTEKIVEAVKSAGYNATEKQKKNTVSIEKLEKKASRILIKLIASIVFLLALMTVSMGHMIGIELFSHDMHLQKGITELILLTPIAVLNFHYFTSGFRSLFRLAPNMDTLIALGAAASIIYSLYMLFFTDEMHFYFESAAMILTFITIGKYLESKSKSKTTQAVTKLMDLSPKTSVVLVNGVETFVDSDKIRQDDTVVVKSSMVFPADGIIVHGSGTVDESAITGESIPVDKETGDYITGGTMLLSGYVHFKATRVGEETTLSGIIRLVEQATNSKPKIARLADRISLYFVPAVILIALLTIVIWGVVSKSFGFALNFGISVLVISCPCALGLATPTAIMVGTGRAAQLGVLVKSAEIFEAGNKISTVMLDKTGTITSGVPEVSDFIVADNDERESLAEMCSAIEAMSEHPLAKAITEYKPSKDKSVQNYSYTQSKGISGDIDGRHILIGNLAFVSESNDRYGLVKASSHLNEQGKTVLYVSSDGVLSAVYGIADSIKPTSKEAIQLLHRDGITTVMLTGDNLKTALAVAGNAGIDTVKSSLMPSEKNEIIAQYQLTHKVAMVGDGINDSPALSAADVGIALGAGTDIAMDCADVVLISNDLRDVHTVLRLCRKVMTNIKENLFWAMIYNVICIPIAAGALYIPLGLRLSPMVGTIAMSLSSVCVVMNALRIRWYKKERTRVAKMKTVFIDKMMCEHCKSRIEESLRQLDTAVSVDLSAKTATVASSVSDEAIRKAVEDAGYTVIKIV